MMKFLLQRFFGLSLRSRGNCVKIALKSSNSTLAFRSTQLNLDSSSLNKPEKSKLPCHVRCHVICSQDLI